MKMFGLVFEVILENITHSLSDIQATRFYTSHSHMTLHYKWQWLIKEAVAEVDDHHDLPSVCSSILFFSSSILLLQRG